MANPWAGEVELVVDGQLRVCKLTLGALAELKDFRRVGTSVFAWYQFSREANSAGLRRAYVRWPLVGRLERRRRTSARGLRGGSWNNNDSDNLLSSYRNHNPADNRNNNIGFRCVLVGVSSRKAASGPAR